MKKTNTILIILIVIFWGALFYQGNAQIHIPDSVTVISGTAEPYILEWTEVQMLNVDQKELEFNAVAPALLLMELYMFEIRSQEVNIGWDIILSENGDMTFHRPVYFPNAIPYLQLYDFNHDYHGNILYGIDGSAEINEYGHYLKEHLGIKDYIRAERIWKPKKPSFEDFYKWSQEYFKKQLK